MSARSLTAATVAAAAIAGALTWMQGASLPAKPDRQAAAAASAASEADWQAAPGAVSVYAKTHEQVDQLAGLRSDPTLRLDPSSTWLPAGGLAILTSPSGAPAGRLAALPAPAPIVAAADALRGTEGEAVPLPRMNPASVAAVPMRPQNAAPVTVASAPDAAAPDAAVDSKPASGGFFGMLRNLFTPQQTQTARAMLSTNPRTAIYDISAHVVYMPNGETLEAHSGLAQWLDDPESYSRKDRGVTPPNTYKISMREKPFHGVQALRLTPVGEASMYGRDGMLAHTYMLGENGQSNGCVSFKDYDRFLQAFSGGEVDRLIVVPHLRTAVAQAS